VTVESTTVALILIVTAVVLVRLLAGNAPGNQHFTWSVFQVTPGTSFSALFLGVVFGSGTIGTLILLVAYVLASIGCIMLVFVRRKLQVPMWQIVIPIAGLVVLGYTLYRNVIPYPTGDGRWFPVTAGVWLLAAVVAVIVAPGTARKLGDALAAREGIKAPDGETAEVPAQLETS
jgi:hypothetical protein